MLGLSSRQLFPKLVALVLTLGLIALVSASAAAGKRHASPKLIDVTIGNSADWYTSEYVVAQRLGLWKAAGLRAHPETFATPVAGIPAMVSGKLDFIDSGPGGVRLAMQGQGVVVATSDLSLTDFLIADSSIKTVADLKGKPVAVSEGTTGQITLFEALKSAGLSLSDVKSVNVPTPPEIVSAFVGGTVSAAATWAPFSQTILQKEPSAHILATDAKGTYPEHLVLPDVWQAAPALVRSHPDIVKRFLWVQMKLNNWVIKHPYTAAKWTAAYLKQPIAVMESNAPPKNVGEITTSKLLSDYRSGTATKWLTALGTAFKEIGTLKSVPPTSRWLNWKLAIQTEKKLSQATYDG